MSIQRTEWQSKQGKASPAATYLCAVSGRVESKFQNPILDTHPPGL